MIRTKCFLVINGAINADFHNCHGATNIRINDNTTLKNNTYGDKYPVKMTVYKGDKKLVK